jgi:hypothetical protein
VARQHHSFTNLKRERRKTDITRANFKSSLNKDREEEYFLDEMTQILQLKPAAAPKFPYHTCISVCPLASDIAGDEAPTREAVIVGGSLAVVVVGVSLVLVIFFLLFSPVRESRLTRCIGTNKPNLGLQEK